MRLGPCRAGTIAIRAALLVLLAVPTAGASDAEFFVGLIPGTELTEDELAQYSGRGLNLAHLERFFTQELTTSSESRLQSLRERVSEIRSQLLGESRISAARARIDSLRNRILRPAQPRRTVDRSRLARPARPATHPGSRRSSSSSFSFFSSQ